jgi:predicted amidohydrolase YtcJ
MELVSRSVPAASMEDRARALRATVDAAHRLGVTSIQTPVDTVGDLELLADARRAGDLSVRVYAALSVSSVLDERAIQGLDDVLKEYPDDPLFKAGAIEIVLDGAIETETAAMLQPYTTGTAAGQPTIGDDELNRMVRLLDARSWQVMTHGVGDRAVRMALNAYQHAARSNPRTSRGRRHRIEHVETIDQTDVPRFGALNVIASMQPYRGSPNPNLESWTRNIGPARAARGWAYGRIAAEGGRLAFGSDWPAVSLNPMLGLHTAVTRATPENLPEGGWNPVDRLTLKRAIDAYTSDAAWASFDEQRKGALKAGMLADLVVLSDDIFSARPAALASTRVSVTVFDGKVVYRRDGRATN